MGFTIHQPLTALSGGQVLLDDYHLSYLEAPVKDREGRKLRFAAANRVVEKRMKTFLTKEPTTIVWLNQFAKGSVFLDIGANIGLYSLYAAAVRECKVYSFEPEALNYAELAKNVFLNRLGGKVSAYCMAMSDVDRLSQLFLSRFAPSYSHHDAGENAWRGPVTELAKSPADRPIQGVPTARVDTMIKGWELPSPDHVKIDVDGFESKVVTGMNELLTGPNPPKSVLMEVDFRVPESRETVAWFIRNGWQFSKDQVVISQHGCTEYDTWKEAFDRGIGGSNVIFYRDDLYTTLFRDYRAVWGPAVQNCHFRKLLDRKASA